jgi:cytoskeletal protein CcmA (bactofilin family)
MRPSPFAKLAVAITIAGALVWVPLQAAAADLRQGNDVTVASGQTINDDLYAAAGTITVDGNVNGSVIVTGGTITIAGTVSRDVIVAGGTITVSGRVGGSIRAAGGNLTLNAPVEQDIVVAGGMVAIGSHATIGRDLVIGGGTATVSAPIARNVLMGAGTLTLHSKVGGTVRGSVDHLKLDGAQVAGNLDYTSNNQVELANGAKVAGTTTRHQPASRDGAANAFIGWLRALIGILALGLLFVLFLPRLSTRSIDTLRAQPWASLGIGAAILVATPITALIIFIIGLLIGGWWLGLLLIPFWILACALGYVVSGFLLGRVVFARLGWGAYHDALALLAGLFILAVVTVIPLIGWLIGLAAFVFGLGALGLAITRWAQPMRAAL